VQHVTLSTVQRNNAVEKQKKRRAVTGKLCDAAGNFDRHKVCRKLFVLFDIFKVRTDMAAKTEYNK